MVEIVTPATEQGVIAFIQAIQTRTGYSSEQAAVVANDLMKQMGEALIAGGQIGCVQVDTEGRVHEGAELTVLEILAITPKDA